MALSMSAAVLKIHTVIDAISGIERVYSAAHNDANKIPDAISEFPSVVILPGPDAGPYILSHGSHRHTYDVRVLVFLRAGGDQGESIYQGIGMVDAIIEAFAGQVGLGGTVNSCLFERQSGYVVLEWNGIEHSGIEITLRVSEQASATPALGD